MRVCRNQLLCAYQINEQIPVRQPKCWTPLLHDGAIRLGCVACVREVSWILVVRTRLVSQSRPLEPSDIFGAKRRDSSDH